MEVSKGTLYLIHTLLGETDPASVLPARVAEVISRLGLFFVENEKSARAFLKLFPLRAPLRELAIKPILSPAELPRAMAPVVAGGEAGVLSEAGCPCVADPGNVLVRFAHAHGIRVVPLVGPSSILLALMASGLNGQRFRFNGYLPAETEERRRAIRRLEEDSRTLGQTEIFMDTPYRSDKVLRDVLESCRPGTLFSVASNLTTGRESVETRTIAEWRRAPPVLGKSPAMMLLLSEQ